MTDQRELVGDPADGYSAACYVWQTPYRSISEWQRAIRDAIPESERCSKCHGSGTDVILASNGGVGEVVACSLCWGSRRQSVLT